MILKYGYKDKFFESDLDEQSGKWLVEKIHTFRGIFLDRMYGMKQYNMNADCAGILSMLDSIAFDLDDERYKGKDSLFAGTMNGIPVYINPNW